jgi:hypothetical protein
MGYGQKGLFVTGAIRARKSFISAAWLNHFSQTFLT